MLKPATVKTASELKNIKRVLRDNLRLAIAIVLVITLLLALYIVQNKDRAPLIACGLRDDETISVGSHKLATEVVTTTGAQEKGLGGRACIGQNEAMLFVFSKPAYYYMWMKDMQFPIDIIWLAANHKTVTVERNLSPSTYPSNFTSYSPAQYVIELAANRSLSLDINAGTTISF